MSEVIQIPIDSPTSTASRPVVITPDPHDKVLLCLRCIGLGVFTGTIVHAAIDRSWGKFFAAYTQWGLGLSWGLYILLIIESAQRRKRNCLLRFNEVAFALVWCTEFVVTVFFWGGLVVLLVMKPKQTDISWWFYSLEAHTLPLVFLYLDMRRNHYVFKIKSLPYTYIPYGPYILTATLLSNLAEVTTYPVLDWKDWISALICVGMAGLNFLGFYIGRRLTVKSKITPVADP